MRWAGRIVSEKHILTDGAHFPFVCEDRGHLLASSYFRKMERAFEGCLCETLRIATTKSYDATLLTFGGETNYYGVGLRRKVWSTIKQPGTHERDVRWCAPEHNENRINFEVER